MRIGVVFPQTEFGNDPIAIRDFAQAVEGLGYTHLLAYDHVLGANPDRPGGWKGGYTWRDPFHEVFVLLSFLSGVTQSLELVTGVVILPQRQTALVAKQAASLDVVSGGRLRLGVGLGWNEVEYIGLNENFHTRGRRMDEQVELLRKLWTAPLVDFKGKWHHIPDAGLNPLPLQRPIPIWFGGHAEPMLRRIARLGDGWFPLHRSVVQARSDLDLLYRLLEEAGRKRSELGIEAHINYRAGAQAEWEEVLQGWQAEGATHLTIATMGCGFEKPADHLGAVEEFARVAGIQPVR